MKKFLALLYCSISISSLFAQWAANGASIYNTNNGFVGIGTSTPGGPLHIRSPFDNALTLQSTDNLWLYTNWLDNTGIRKTWMGLNSDLSTFAISLENGANKIVLNGGYVGINTFSPAATLDVQGNMRLGNVSTPAGYRLYVEQGILTERVKVALKSSANWADHVFAPGYQLKPLTEVEKFITQNQHLPGVPAAETLVKEGGVDVNVMLAKQMEKIEELTLYVIKQGKEITALKKENILQRKQITRLQQRR